MNWQGAERIKCERGDDVRAAGRDNVNGRPMCGQYGTVEMKRSITVHASWHNRH
jgi:hypothetical protein